MKDLLRDVRGYLSFLSMMGIEGIPYLPVRSTQTGQLYTQNIPSEGGNDLETPFTLEAIREEIGNCKRCKLSGSRRNIVFGTGNPHAKVVFVGEGPGREEDIQGLPFVGAAGEMLTRIIERVLKLKRADVYIANVVKCRPPENRTPQPDEIAQCLPFLEKQLEVIKPGIIVALGAIAAQSLLGTKTGITTLRGRFHYYRGNTVVMPTYHPAYLLRSPDKKKQTHEDMLMVKERLGELTND